MAKIHVQILGLKEFQAAFKKAPQEFTKHFDTAIKKAVLTIQGASRVNTPVGDTQFLRGAGYRTDFGALTGSLENKAPYAIFVHDGTKKMRARPFMQEGLEAVQGEVDGFFDKALEDFSNAI